MADRPKQPGEREGVRINVSRKDECHRWAEKFDISPDDLRKIVRQVGPLVGDVRRCLRARVKKDNSK